MAYRDPYTERPVRFQTQPHYESADYNPYSTTQPHQAYNEGNISPSYDNYGDRYRDEPHMTQEYPPRRGPSQRTVAGGPLAIHDKSLPLEPPPSKENVFDTAGADGFTTSPPGEKTASALRNYRYNHQGNLWNKGGRGRCVGRFCCCTIMVGILLFISIILALALWVRPPNITIGGVQTMAKNGSAIQLQEDGITINLGVNISVANPNYFSVSFKQIKADIIYPINSTNIGEGISKDLVFNSHSQKNFTFPFSINYKTNLDPQSLILLDLAQKCGLTGTKSNISVNYKITLGLRIAFVTISPVVSNTFTFMCPIDKSDLEALMKSTGINIGGLLGGT